MEYENDKQVIFFKDIFFAIVYCWKAIVVAAIVGALLLGGVQIYRNHSVAEPALSQATTEKIQRLDQQITAKENAIAYQQYYLENSYLLSMDPYNVYQINLSVYVHTDYQILPGMQYQNPDNTAVLVNAYHTLLGDGTLIKQIADALQIDAKYIPELISSEITNSSNPGLLMICITHNNEQKALIISSLIESFLTDYTEQFQKDLGVHELRFISTSSGLRTSQNIADQQKKATEYLSTLHTELEKLEKQRSDLKSATSTTSATFMAIVGGVLGMTAVIACAFFVHLSSGKVYSGRVLTNRTGIKVLGCIPASKKRDLISRWLRKAEGRNLCADSINVAATVTANLCSGAKQVLIAVSYEVQSIDLVQKTLEHSGLQVCRCDSLLHNAEALKLLPGCDTVVLIEKCAESTYTDVEQAMECVADHGKTLLGCILIDG